MILKHIPRKDWAAKLERHGCKPMAGMPDLETAEWWQSPDGDPFVVPYEGKKGYCEFWALQKLCQQYGLPIPVLEAPRKKAAN